MTSSFMTRSALAWLLLAQLVIMAPQLEILPFWTSLVWAVVAWWNWKVYRGDWHFPSAPVKWGLCLLALFGIYLKYRTPLALEPQLALLVVAFILKLLEMKTRRDQWIVLFLGYFIIGCSFIFDTTFVVLPIALGQLAVLLLAQQAIYREKTVLRPMLRTTWQLFYQSVPLMLLLFLVFPRFGPLWAVPLPSNSARTGMSDSMSPGDIAKLSRSGELAFRVEFEGDIPAQHLLYWRGLVLESFDGRRWERAPTLRQRANIETGQGQRLSYQVTLESGVHDWLYALTVADVRREDIRQTDRYELLPRQPLTGRLGYAVVSYPQQPLSQPLDRYGYYLNLNLPRAGNPRARELAEQWKAIEDPIARLRAIESFFRAQPFVYTLEPPLLGENSIDEFLFQTRRGYCEHYASSYVFLARAAGMPARVVVGYQGGERNPLGNYLLVHQSDAHAWAEVWVEGQGWLRSDPTSFVAPDRIRAGADEALAGQGGYLADAPFSLRNFGNLRWIAQMRYWMDSMEYAWAKWVLNFDSERQWEALDKLLGDISATKLGLIFLAAFLAPLALVAVLTLRPARRPPQAPAVKYYLRACRWLADKGIERAPGESPRHFADRVRREQPDLSEWFDDVTEAFYRSQYLPVRGEDQEVQVTELRRLTRRPYRATV